MERRNRLKCAMNQLGYTQFCFEVGGQRFRIPPEIKDSIDHLCLTMDPTVTHVSDLLQALCLLHHMVQDPNAPLYVIEQNEADNPHAQAIQECLSDTRRNRKYAKEITTILEDQAANRGGMPAIECFLGALSIDRKMFMAWLDHEENACPLFTVDPALLSASHAYLEYRKQKSVELHSKKLQHSIREDIQKNFEWN